MPRTLYLNKKELEVIDRHLEAGDNAIDVFQWSGFSSSMINEHHIRVHNDKKHRSGRQDLHFYSSRSPFVGTLTCKHAIKLRDLRRKLSDRETSRLQGSPEDFVLPSSRVVQLFGNAVAVPCAEHACSRVLDGHETRHLDICAGIGGFAIAAKRCAPNIACVGFCEISCAAIACYRSNFGNAVELGNVFDVKAFPQCDLLTAGFPCQPFSTANTKNPLEKHPSCKFFETILSAIDSSSCSKVVLENVPTFLSIGKKYFDDLIKELTKRGFEVQYGILDSSRFGLKQKRKRLFICCRQDGKAPLPFEIPEYSSSPTSVQDILEQ